MNTIKIIFITVLIVLVMLFVHTIVPWGVTQLLGCGAWLLGLVTLIHENRSIHNEESDLR